MTGKRLNRPGKILLLFVAAVFLLPVYGSWVDVTYAERQPAHKHIYLGNIDPHHHQSTAKNDVVNLPNQDATGQQVVLLFLPDIQLVPNSAEMSHLSFGLSEEYLSPEDAFLPPPDYPPKV